ncbi:serine protease [Shewanella sp. WXL01]|uniref:serine protease n=1 Tax=Shewanella sp. WXL01 TaxID=2709721 RepID=UPI0014384AF1|nr:serine protease [Shewanella sp. WXL01]NKF50654.1 serine protease [Shewanella sp. WXL01]
MKNTLIKLVGLSFAALLVGCAAQTEPKNMPGSDRGEHGCIGSAGYTWCAATNQCERPWELAEEKGFENTEKAFDAFCSK